MFIFYAIVSCDPCFIVTSFKNADKLHIWMYAGLPGVNRQCDPIK